MYLCTYTGTEGGRRKAEGGRLKAEKQRMTTKLQEEPPGHPPLRDITEKRPKTTEIPILVRVFHKN